MVHPIAIAQGSAGSHFHPTVREALEKARACGAEVIVVFKGFVEGVDSFGSFKYSPDYFHEKNLSFVAKAQQAGVRQCTISTSRTT